jgi:phosphoribosyl-AMP cyclohydrolase
VTGEEGLLPVLYIETAPAQVSRDKALASVQGFCPSCSCTRQERVLFSLETERNRPEFTYSMKRTAAWEKGEVSGDKESRRGKDKNKE